MKTKVIIDTDPGIDDAIALLLALHAEELDVLGITTVAGNIDVERGTENALKIIEYCGRVDVPVYKGSDRPLVKPLTITDECHGVDGLGDIGLPAPQCRMQEEDAVDFIIDTVATYPNEVQIITIGPLTNIARAIEKNPKVMQQCAKIVSMGGAIGAGNMSPVAEFNYWVDPEAAAIVYRFSIPIQMVGLDVTTKFVLTPSDIEYIKLGGGKHKEILLRLYDYYAKYHWEYENVLGCYLHDPMTVAVACHPTLVESVHCNVQISTGDVTRGECVTDVIDVWGERKNCFASTSVNADAFRKYFFQTLYPELMPNYDLFNNNLKKIGSV